MSNWWKKVQTAIQERQRLRVLAFAVLCISAVILLAWGVSVRTQTIFTRSVSIGTTTTPMNDAPSVRGPIASSSKPVRISIPSINVSTVFEEPLGLDEEGALGVPEGYDTVGWYRYSPTPGELGPSVILGHVDSYEGPAVFFSLGQVNVGDPIEIEREDGSVVVFSITGYERVEQTAFPTDRVYNDISHAGIRLITCSGIFDKGAQRYSHNLIVYGELSEIRYPEKSTE